MRELHFFLGAYEADDVLSDDVAAARHREADRAGHSGPRLSLTLINGQLVEPTTARSRDAFPQSERRARRRVDLVPMVRFGDLDVIAVAESLRGEEHLEQIIADAQEILA